MNAKLQLTDQLITLRPPQSADWPALLEAVRESLAELQPWMDWATPAYTATSAQNWLEYARLAWEHTSGFPFVISETASNAYLGHCGLDGLNPSARSCNLGYWVRTRRAGQGIATRAIRLAAHFAFETAGLTRVEIVIAARNLASQRAAQKAGARFEGPSPKPLIVRTEIHEAVVYSLTPQDLIE